MAREGRCKRSLGGGTKGRFRQQTCLTGGDGGPGLVATGHHPKISRDLRALLKAGEDETADWGPKGAALDRHQVSLRRYDTSYRHLKPFPYINVLYRPDLALTRVGFRERDPPWRLGCWLEILGVVVVGVTLARPEVEHVKQIADCRTVGRHVWVVVAGDRVRQIVAAAGREWREFPIALDEFQDRGVIGVAMRHLTAAREGRCYDHGNARSVTEEIERLDIPRIVVAAAFIKGDEDRCFRFQLRILLECIQHLFQHRFVEVELRTRRMAVQKPVRLEEGYGRQAPILHRREEVDGVLDMLLPLSYVAHDRAGIGFEIADVAICQPDRMGRVGRAVRQVHR